MHIVRQFLGLVFLIVGIGGMLSALVNGDSEAAARVVVFLVSAVLAWLGTRFLS